MWSKVWSEFSVTWFDFGSAVVSHLNKWASLSREKHRREKRQSKFAWNRCERSRRRRKRWEEHINITLISGKLLTLIFYHHQRKAEQWHVSVSRRSVVFQWILLPRYYNESIRLWFWWSQSQSVKHVWVNSEQTHDRFRRTKYPNYSEARVCWCHLTYTQLLFCLTALHRHSTQHHIETQLNKRPLQFMYTDLCTNTHRT